MVSPYRTRYFQSFIVLAIILLLGLLFIKQGDLVLLINQHRSGFLDLIMPYVTLLGDGWFYGIITLIILVWKWRLGLFFAFAGGIQALASAVLKRVIFGPLPRPLPYFEQQGITLDLIAGIEYARLFTFPSGHTMTAFMLMALLSFTILPRRYHLGLLLLAVIVGFSRIYLLQHFYRDVVAGAIIGVLLATLLVSWLLPTFEKIGLKQPS